MLLRFGPRQREVDEHGFKDNEDFQGYSATALVSGGANRSIDETMDPELQPLQRLEGKLTSSIRQRASLGGIL